MHVFGRDTVRIWNDAAVQSGLCDESSGKLIGHR
jgi:hypothetical protein